MELTFEQTYKQITYADKRNGGAGCTCGMHVNYIT